MLLLTIYVLFVLQWRWTLIQRVDLERFWGSCRKKAVPSTLSKRTRTGHRQDQKHWDTGVRMLHFNCFGLKYLDKMPLVSFTKTSLSYYCCLYLGFGIWTSKFCNYSKKRHFTVSLLLSCIKSHPFKEAILYSFTKS